MTAPTGTKTIRFTEAAEVDYLDGAGLRKYVEGSTHTMRSDKADRWIRRSKAVDVTSRETVDVAGPAVLRQPDDEPRAPVAQAASPAQPVTAVTAGGAVASGVTQHGNTVASAQAVGGADGGSDGQRAVHVPRRGGGGSRG